jgi:hypothetical protein
MSEIVITGGVGGMLNINGRESVDPPLFVAVTITPYLVPEFKAVNVAFTAVEPAVAVVAFSFNASPVIESLKEYSVTVPVVKAFQFTVIFLAAGLVIDVITGRAGANLIKTGLITFVGLENVV